ncbi:MAG: carboxypeptidase regulatory-like domain-containing protein [Candidatus Bipolaricaulota bacterium]
MGKDTCRRRAALALLTIVLSAGLSTLSAAKDTTITLGQEDASTLNVAADAETAGKLISEAYEAGELTQLIYYGNWYGPGWSGGSKDSKAGNKQPIDALDAIAQRHDFAYDIAAEQGKIHGPAEEARLRSLADAIAVRDANALPRNPREWRPPAPDPDKANNYRKRIGFGFRYESSFYDIEARLRAIKVPFLDREEVTTSGFGEDDLDRMARERAAEWFQRKDVRPIFRIELSASIDLIEEGGTADVGFRLVPILNEGSTAPGVSRQGIDPALLGRIRDAIAFEISGYGRIARKTADSVQIATTKKWLGLGSTVGTTITLKATYGGSDADVVEDSVSFGVALGTRFSTLRPSPNYTEFWPMQILTDDAEPCHSIGLNAWLVTSSGDAVRGMPLTFSREDGVTATAVTDEEGYATVTMELCPELLGDASEKDIAFVVTTASPSVGGNFYIMSTGTMLVHAKTHVEPQQIRGRVVDEGRGGRPIQGALVKLTDSIIAVEQVTDSDGWFSISVSLPTSENHLTVTANGYRPKSLTAKASFESRTIGLYPLEATLIGHVVNEMTGKGIDGATVHVTAPFDQLLNTRGGEFSITGLFVGDTVTLRADAQNFRAYVKSGRITTENPVVTFSLKPGSGEQSSELDPTEATEEDRRTALGSDKLYSLMVWASPADPAVFQDVTLTAQIFPPLSGVQVEVKMHGTDGYASSISAMTDAMGRVLLPIPGAESGVIDDVVAWIVGTDVKQRLRYSF